MNILVPLMSDDEIEFEEIKIDLSNENYNNESRLEFREMPIEMTDRELEEIKNHEFGKGLLIGAGIVTSIIVLMFILILVNMSI